MAKGAREGICKLTGCRGRFVDSHLIPKALTRPLKPGAPFWQGGSDHPPLRRWSSWYDPALVTSEGEAILSRHDNWAIAELRKHRMVWSGWGPALRLPAEHTAIPNTPWGIRIIRDIDTVRLRLFVLSLLWRGAASSLPEFSEIQLPPDDIEQLRLLLVADIAGLTTFYPSSLTQLSTMGEIHNHTPIAQLKSNPAIDNLPAVHIPIFRYYFDGLIVHVIRQASDIYQTVKLGSLIVGNSSDLTINTVEYEASFQRQNLELLRANSAAVSSKSSRNGS